MGDARGPAPTAHRHRVCPWWLGYWLVNPLRRLVEPPHRLFGPLVRPGMLVLEPGCGMGYFTLDLARRVGARGRVVAVDLQERMLAALRRRARRRGLAGRVDARLATSASLGVADLDGSVDLAVALHVAHEVPDQARFFAELAAALRPGAVLLLVEPPGHVTEAELAASLAAARAAGLRPRPGPPPGPRSAVLEKRG